MICPSSRLDLRQVLFAGEHPSLDITQAATSMGSGQQAARDLAYVIVSASLNGTVYSDGPVETGGYYVYRHAARTYYYLLRSSR